MSIKKRDLAEFFIVVLIFYSALIAFSVYVTYPNPVESLNSEAVINLDLYLLFPLFNICSGIIIAIKNYEKFTIIIATLINHLFSSLTIIFISKLWIIYRDISTSELIGFPIIMSMIFIITSGCGIILRKMSTIHKL